jgi:HK97 family phage prohead protease
MANKTELRSLRGALLVRADEGSAEQFALEGIACAYNTPSAPMQGPNGTFIERVAPGAFRNSLRAGGDVKALFNHDANHILGRLKNKTLRLTDTSAGLCFRVQLDRRNSSHVGIYSSVKRGDVDECSFAFTVRAGGQTWSRDYKKRTLTDLDLLDVSIVTTPAYPVGTSVAARSAGASPVPKGVYVTDWRLTVALKLAQLDAQYEHTINKLEKGA